MSNFISMPPGDRWYLIVLIGLSIIAFLPPWREMEVAGLSMLGWWMAFLMVYVPTSALIRFLWTDKPRKSAGEDQ